MHTGTEHRTRAAPLGNRWRPSVNCTLREDDKPLENNSAQALGRARQAAGLTFCLHRLTLQRSAGDADTASAHTEARAQRRKTVDYRVSIAYRNKAHCVSTCFAEGSVVVLWVTGFTYFRKAY